MNDGLVEQIRLATCGRRRVSSALANEAADEIEQLQADNQLLRDVLEVWFYAFIDYQTERDRRAPESDQIEALKRFYLLVPVVARAVANSRAV